MFAPLERMNTLEVSADLRAFAEELALIAIGCARPASATPGFELKDDGSPVTNVDKDIERAVRRRIAEKYPDHGILGEEFGARNPEADLIWVIDPIDGTRQFAAGLPNYGILIALCENSVPRLGLICQPETGDIYLGISGQGTWLNGKPVRASQVTTMDASILCICDPDAFDDARRPGMERLRTASLWNVFDGGCLGFGALAAGKIAVSVCGPNLENFDICALVPIVEGAGGVISDWQGRPLDLFSKGEIVASANEELHLHVLMLLDEA